MSVTMSLYVYYAFKHKPGFYIYYVCTRYVYVKMVKQRQKRRSVSCSMFEYVG